MLFSQSFAAVETFSSDSLFIAVIVFFFFVNVQKYGYFVNPPNVFVKKWRFFVKNRLRGSLRRRFFGENRVLVFFVVWLAFLLPHLEVVESLSVDSYDGAL